MKSPCFEAGELACTSCHSLHDSHPSDQLAKGMDGDRACVQCHEQIAPQIEAHTHHAKGSTGSRCYNCHMPNTTWALSTAMRSHRIDSPVVDASRLNARPNACNLCHLDKTLAWTGEKLREWYGIAPPVLDEDQETLAASVVWLVQGNALQRAISAWHMGWEPALQASGTGWQPAMLAQLLDDPYSQVRCVAGRALRKQPGFSGFAFDFLAPAAERQQAQRQALRNWQQRPSPRSHSDALPIRGTRELAADVLARLRAQRDDTPIDVPE